MSGEDALAVLARQAWMTLEPIHVLGYFAPENAQAYAELGVAGRAGYFAARSAAMGAVEPEVVVATFYVFAPRAVHAVLPQAWAKATPEQVLGARHAAMAAVLHRLGGNVDVSEAVDLVRIACEPLRPHGRPLFAAHAGLPEPTDPLLQLWHGATLLREHRGDGHVNALLHAGLAPLESLALNGAAVGSTTFMEQRRGWTPQEWADARSELVQQGLLTPEHELSTAGRTLVDAVEAQTDSAALEGWSRLGPDGCRRLIELVGPLRAAVSAEPGMPAWLTTRT